MRDLFWGFYGVEGGIPVGVWVVISLTCLDWNDTVCIFGRLRFTFFVRNHCNYDIMR